LLCGSGEADARAPSHGPWAAKGRAADPARRRRTLFRAWPQGREEGLGGVRLRFTACPLKAPASARVPVDLLSTWSQAAETENPGGARCRNVPATASPLTARHPHAPRGDRVLEAVQGSALRALPPRQASTAGHRAAHTAQGAGRRADAGVDNGRKEDETADRRIPVRRGGPACEPVRCEERAARRSAGSAGSSSSGGH